MKLSTRLMNLIESTDRLSVQEIWDIVKDFKYGIWDKSLNDLVDYEEFDYTHHENWRILTPEETMTFQGGVCWDQALCISYLAHKSDLKYCFHFVSDHTNTLIHTFCVIKQGNEYWYPETAYPELCGLHGPFTSYSDVLSYFSNSHYEAMESLFLIFRNNIDVTALFNDNNISPESFLITIGVPTYLVDQLWNEDGWWTATGVTTDSDSIAFKHDDYLRVTGIYYPDGTFKEWDYQTGNYK